MCQNNTNLGKEEVTMPVKLGRKFEYDINQFDALVDSVEEAMGSFGQVADINKITRNKIYYWLRKGDEDIDNGISSDLAQLSSRLRKKQAEVIMSIVKNAYLDKDKVRFMSFWLSKIHREDFGSEGIELKELRDLFKIVLPLLGKDPNEEPEFHS